MEKVQHYFTTHPESTCVYETANGFLFHRIGDADAHAQTLPDKNVKTWERTDVDNQPEAEENAEEKTAKKATKKTA